MTPPKTAKAIYFTINKVLYENDHTPMAFIMPISLSSLLIEDLRLKSIVIIATTIIETATIIMLRATMSAKRPSFV